MQDLTADDVRQLIRNKSAPFASVSRWAKSAGISQTYAFDVVSGKTEPGPRICKALGLERMVFYREVSK